jgi:hypothetical protein
MRRPNRAALSCASWAARGELKGRWTGLSPEGYLRFPGDQSATDGACLVNGRATNPSP